MSGVVPDDEGGEGAAFWGGSEETAGSRREVRYASRWRRGQLSAKGVGIRRADNQRGAEPPGSQQPCAQTPDDRAAVRPPPTPSLPADRARARARCCRCRCNKALTAARRGELGGLRQRPRAVDHGARGALRVGARKLAAVGGEQREARRRKRHGDRQLGAGARGGDGLAGRGVSEREAGGRVGARRAVAVLGLVGVVGAADLPLLWVWEGGQRCGGG